MSQTILGIDLGTSSVKVLLLERRVHDLSILDFIEEPLSTQSRLPHEEQVVSILKKIFDNHVLDADVVCMAFPGHLLSSRVLTLPFTNSKKISQLIEFELESFIPFPIEDILSDYHILSHTGTESDVLAIYAQDDNFRKYLDALASANIESKYFGADFTDLAALAQISIVPKEGYYVICDIGHSGTNVLIMEGKDLKYVRAIGVGGYHFTRSIQRTFNLNQEKAEALKLSRGKLCVRDQDSDQISRLLNRVAMELVASIKQTFYGAKKHCKDFNVTAIYCCGGGSRLVGMHEHLSFHLKVNVFELEVLNFINHKFEDVEEINTIIPQVLSSAIHPIYSNRIPKINFRKGPYAYKQDLQMITSELKSIAVLFLAIVILGFGYYFYADHFYSKKMAGLDRHVYSIVKKDFRELTPKKIKKSKKNKKRRKKSIRSYLKAAKKKLKELKQSSPEFAGFSKNVVDVMYDISKSLPPKSKVNFEVREFAFADDFVRLNALTNDTLNVEKIVAALQESKTFSNIESSDAQPKPGNVWSFTLKLRLKKTE